MGHAAHLGIKLHEYDSRIRTFIPDYEEMLDQAAETVARLGRRKPRIVDLGTGSGALAARCLAAVPGARVTGIDADAGMLGLATRRMGNGADAGGRRFRAGAAAGVPRRHRVVRPAPHLQPGREGGALPSRLRGAARPAACW